MNKLLSLLTGSLLPSPLADNLQSLGLLFLRLTAGGVMLVAHGWGKLLSFGETSSQFPDPLGVGSTLSMALAVGAEVFCALAVVIGLATRWAVIPLIITMLVAAFVIHGDDPWNRKEFALLYCFPYVTLLLTGAGRFSLDHVLARKLTSAG